jgi:fluoride exporter
VPRGDHDDVDTAQVAVDPDLLPRAARAPGTVRARLGPLIAVALGGALGSPARYAIGRVLPPSAGGFPWATFLINVVGSFALGALVTSIAEQWPPSRFVRPFAAIGFLGAFTTFSTYMVESDLLVKDGRAGIALVYVAASLFVGLAAAYLGLLSPRLRRSA